MMADIDPHRITYDPNNDLEKVTVYWVMEHQFPQDQELDKWYYWHTYTSFKDAHADYKYFTGGCKDLGTKLKHNYRIRKVTRTETVSTELMVKTW